MSYSYQQIHLIPRYSKNLSRSEINTSTQFGPRKFKIPVLPANMACTINGQLSKWMSENDYFYIMHRFNEDKSAEPNHDNWEFLVKANRERWKTISISLGVQDYDKEFLIKSLDQNLRIDYLCLDIAHAHSIRMKEMLEFINTLYSSLEIGEAKPFIIAGNAATPEAVLDIESWGADSVKVGIAGGSACSTFGQTGFHVPMWTCIQECSKVAKKPIIADGGIRTNGDFAKALVAGGTMVMAGSMFASSIDSPAKTISRNFKSDELYWEHRSYSINNFGSASGEFKNKIKEKVFKQYYGSASAYNKSVKTHIEGTLVELECDGTTYADKLSVIEGCLQSSISYAGGDLSSVRWGVIGA